MCAAYGKLLINAALGFDTYLVMRHGESCATHSTSSSGSEHPAEPVEPRWGCYFCNDIVAATNSQRDRSLDQQCTVTRPGLSFIAAALCVELMVALMHRTDTSEADVSDPAAADEAEEGSGLPSAHAPKIPHQIRGSVAGFTQFTPHVRDTNTPTIFFLSYTYALLCTPYFFDCTDSRFQQLYSLLGPHRGRLPVSGL